MSDVQNATSRAEVAKETSPNPVMINVLPGITTGSFKTRIEFGIGEIEMGKIGIHMQSQGVCVRTAGR